MFSSSKTSEMSLKLVIDKKNQKLIFAESDKEFVHFLFNLLNLPLGTVTRLVTASKMAGSVGNVYGSVQILDGGYMESGKGRDFLLKPVLLPKYAITPLLTEADFSSPKFYTCAYTHCGEKHCSDEPNLICGCCSREMNLVLKYKAKDVRYIKEAATFIITDDLVVKPLSMESSLTLLGKAGVEELSALEHRVVHVGKEEGMKLLTEAMKSKEVFTNVFLRKTEETAQNAKQGSGGAS